MCRDIMGKSRVPYTEDFLRIEKIHSKLLTDAIEVYRDNANDYALTILENVGACKNNYMYALTKNFFYFER